MSQLIVFMNFNISPHQPFILWTANCECRWQSSEQTILYLPGNSPYISSYPFVYIMAKCREKNMYVDINFISVACSTPIVYPQVSKAAFRLKVKNANGGAPQKKIKRATKELSSFFSILNITYKLISFTRGNASYGYITQITKKNHTHKKKSEQDS